MLNKGFSQFAAASALTLTIASSVYAAGPKPIVRPRLLIDTASNPQARSTDNLVSLLRAETIRQAELELTTNPVQYEIIQGSLLTRSRNALGRIMNLGVAFRATKDARFSNRMKAELNAMAAMPNWYPQHFLGTAEMTTAAAVGYDWLYNELTPTERLTIRTAIIEKGLKPGLSDYEKKVEWTTRTTNWAQVGGAGMGMGALAIMENDPILATKILNYTIPSVRNTVVDYLPEGIPSEGPVYWRYGMNFQTMFHRSLANIYGNRMSLLGNQVYAKTAWYPASVLGTSGKNFNFADASETFVPAPATLELSRQFRNPAVANWTRSRIMESLTRQDRWTEEYRLSALFLEWMPKEANTTAMPPLDQAWSGDQTMVTMRSSWSDNQGLYLGVKAGKNGLAHGQLDLGSFVLDALGERWAIDLGKDSYSLPGYFNGGSNGQRWSYYRNSTRSHNTITFGGANQDWNGSSTTQFAGFNTVLAQTQVNMTSAYTGQATSVSRIFSMINRSAVTIQDEVKGAKTGWRWQMVTTADVELGGKSAQLSLNGKRIRLTITSAAGAFFELGSTAPGTSAENQNTGTRMLVIQQPAGDRTLSVRIEPVLN